MKERNASRKIKSENDGKEEDVSNGTSGHMSTPTRKRRSRKKEEKARHKSHGLQGVG